MAFGKRSTEQSIVVIKSPNFHLIRIPIQGTSNYVSNAFPEEALNMMAAEQAKGTVDKKRKAKPPKDFEAGYRGSLHQSVDGWFGQPCTGYRGAMVRAASLVGVEMTKVKMCVFVEPDGFDPSGQALVRITHGEPEAFQAYVRNANGSADIRSRGRFAPGWRATVSIRFDADFLSQESVVNLLARAGVCVGVGAGRPFSQQSVGMGWGTFEIIGDQLGQQAAE